MGRSAGWRSVPALFVHGRLDAEIPPGVSSTLAALAPNGEFHLAHQEQPAAVNALIRSVLARVATSATAAFS
ncbi:alpha/beta fold hydrolase [Streptomyces sp. NPDC088348]|uniref:alpha/beta fold hydrolase n=1 Tax=Streptomyces sp. NPDC088348 TaxID=3365853 RepID=UPI00382C6DF8